MLDALMSGDIREFLMEFLLCIPIVFLALSFHETAHGYVAYKLGDPTARSLGRLTLNPIKHFDPLGFMCMALFGYGWAKPVPINTRYFKKPKRDMALTAIAGPVTNLLLAIVFAILYRVIYEVAGVIPYTQFNANVFFVLCNFLYLGVYLNVSYAVFNMIPVPPFDGSRVFFVLLPDQLYFKIMKYEKYIYIALLAALFIGVLDKPLYYVTNFFIDLIFKVAF